MVKNTQPTASHYINGQYVENLNGRLLISCFPATGEAIATLHMAGDEQIDAAIASAQAAQKEWQELKGVERGRILRKASDLLRQANDELAELETYDTGKPISETSVVDIVSGADCLEYFAGQAASIAGEHVELGGDYFYTTRMPFGVTLGIGAWNYPIQIACWKSAPALACGNAMIFKPSELTPLSALKLAEIYSQAGLPAGLFNVLQGDGQVGEKLVQQKAIAKISMTGETSTGTKIMGNASIGVRPVSLELGGKSPLIIFEDANVQDAVAGAMLANFYSSGQVCSNATRVFVHSGIKQEFMQELIKRTQALIMGDPRDTNTQIGPLVSLEQAQKVKYWIGQGESEGATVAMGGMQAYQKLSEDSCFAPVTIFTDVQDTMQIALHEIFGPVMCILDFEDEDKVIERANATKYGLSAGVFTQNLARAHRVIRALHAGACWINSYNLTPIEMPFGGVKASGFGRENGRAAIEYYTQTKSVYVGLGPVESPY